MKLLEPFPAKTNILRPEQGRLRVAVLGPPEVIRDGIRLTFSLRKAQALLLYLTVEGGMHSRSKLAAFLWPDSEAYTARTALRNALTLLRSLLEASPVTHSPLITQQDAIGLNPQAPLELDLAVVQQTWKEVQQLSTMPAEPQRTALVARVQHALSLVHGLFLDDFWLGEEAPFDEWVLQQQQKWQIRLHLLCDRLSFWQEAGGELELAQATLVRWLALNPLSEEAYRRLMRVHLARGDASAALQVYTTCRARLAQELQVEPSVETINLEAHIRATATRFPRGRASIAKCQQSGDLITPLVGRTSTFTRLVSCYQQAQQGQPQTMLLVGEAGIGKTRLASEWIRWAQAQGAEVLSGHAFELEARLPYQPLVEALRLRLEEENVPEDLQDNLWLAELTLLLPELHVRYPDLPVPIPDEQMGKLRLFEAVAQLLDALARRAPLVLFLDDLHWLDGASLDLVHYLGRYWKEHSSRVLLLGTVRLDQLKLNLPLLAQLVDLRRDLPISEVTLQPLSQEETLKLLEVIMEKGNHGMRNERVAPELVTLSNWLFAYTRGQPLYLLETLKLFRDREWLVPRLGADNIWRLELVVNVDTIVAQKRTGYELLPPSVRAMILARLSRLTYPAQQLVMASAVLGSEISMQLLWQVIGLEVQDGIEALEEAIKSGILYEETASEPGGYGFSHKLIRKVIYTELSRVQRQTLCQQAQALLSSEGVKTSKQTSQMIST